MNRDEKRIYQGSWYQKNRDRVLSKSKKYYEDNKDVCRKRATNYQQKNKKKIRKRRLKREYGVDGNWFDVMFEKQNGVCAICGLAERVIHGKSGEKQPLCVDHNHNINKTRGLLCGRCNAAVGLLNIDNFGILNLQTAVEYVKSYQNGKFDY